MIIFPAIDLRAGQVVRLRQGDPDAQTVFDDDPAGVAQRWAEAGAEWLHVVNLDGAFGEHADATANLRRLAEIRAAVRTPLQFGGGVRSLAAIRRALDLGATRVVLGTAAVQQPELLAEALAEFGAGRIIAGIDARDGWAATHGWQETSGLRAVDLACQVQALGIERAVYTDIARDGTLGGANLSATLEVARASGLKIIASGGVSSLADLRTLASHTSDGIEGAIVGQALYTGAVDLAEAIAVLQ